MPKQYAIYSDLSGVTKLDTNDGAFETELEAQERLVTMLTGEKARAAELLGKARRRLAHLKKATS